MAETKPPAQPADRLRELAAAQYGKPLAELPGDMGERLVAEAVAWYAAALDSSPSPRATSPRVYALWAANALRSAMCDLSDALELYDGRLAAGQLREVRASHYAAERLGSDAREAWLLTDYLGLSVEGCAKLLGVDATTVGRLTDAARAGIKRGVQGELDLLYELQEINQTSWPVARGIVDRPMIALARDAAHMRMQHAGFFSAGRQELFAYYRTFARLYLGPRAGVCQSLLNPHSVHVSEGLKKKARKTLANMHNAARARLALRRQPAFARGLEPVADDWFALVDDACLPAGPPAESGHVRRTADVAWLADESPDVVERAVTDYRQAVQRWVADNTPDSA